MKSPPAFQFYPQDFLVGTADMTHEQVGVYIRLLCYQWCKGEIPGDPEQFRSLVGSTCEAYALVMQKFERTESGGYKNARLEEVRAKQRAYSISRQKNANCRGISRKQAQSHRKSASAHAEHVQSTCKAYAKHTEDEVEEEVRSGNSVGVGGVGGGPSPPAESVRMSVEEAKFSAGVIGAPEWLAEDLWLELEATGWIYRGQQVRSFSALLTKRKAWWDESGRPMKRPARKVQNGNQTNAPDRNRGLHVAPGRGQRTLEIVRRQQEQREREANLKSMSDGLAEESPPH